MLVKTYLPTHKPLDDTVLQPLGLEKCCDYLVREIKMNKDMLDVIYGLSAKDHQNVKGRFPAQRAAPSAPAAPTPVLPLSAPAPPANACDLSGEDDDSIYRLDSPVGGAIAAMYPFEVLNFSSETIAKDVVAKPNGGKSQFDLCFEEKQLIGGFLIDVVSRYRQENSLFDYQFHYFSSVNVGYITMIQDTSKTNSNFETMVNVVNRTYWNVMDRKYWIVPLNIADCHWILVLIVEPKLLVRLC